MPPTFKEKQKIYGQRQKKLRDNPTIAEIKFRELLDKLGVYYIFQKCFIAGNGFYIVDFYLPAPKRICIEIDGSIHNLPEVIKKDRAKDGYLRGRGFKVLRFSNETVYYGEQIILETLKNHNVIR